MMKKLFVVFLAALLSLLSISPSPACTIMAVGKNASTDDSVMVSHTNDGLSDPRAIYIPAMDHPKEAKRAIFYSHNALDFKPEYGASQTVRLNTKELGPGYDAPNVPKSVPIDYIPQVGHTYAYIDSSYAVINEHQLIMAECTDKAKVHPEPETGKRIFYSVALGRVAMERCKTARQAVELMGSLIDKYGYYGTGETLAVGDPNEAWIFEMCGYDMDGTDGVWVAQRVGDDQFFIAANQFRIRDIIRNKPDQMIYSKNIFDVAQKKGWWNPSDGPLDFTKVYGDGEFHHPYYSKRRVWRGFSLAAPSLNLPAWVESAVSREYPFSLKPDQKLSVKDILNICRDNYEGTEFDLTKGLAAGPFGNPTRFEGNAESVADKEGRLTPVKGYFERPINIYRCLYYHVTQARANMPDGVGGVTWFAPDRAANSITIPLYAGADALPKSLTQGNCLIFDPATLWTANNYVANLLMLKYSYMYKDLCTVRDKIEADMDAKRVDVEKEAQTLYVKGNKKEATALLTKFSNDQSQIVLDAWWKLAQDLFIKYEDGYVNTSEELAHPVFYPARWLQNVGYEKDETSYKKPL
nr:C69 family dipeptidase [uncultured Desulfobacter sp.]